jgi:acetate kinase
VERGSSQGICSAEVGYATHLGDHSDILQDAKNIAYFDSSFHNTIDQSIAKKNGLRKSGFHGISYSFITHAVSTYLNKPIEELNIVALHLGSGASACCIKNGKSHDTSMGLTPLAGLPGATRSGNIGIH